MDPYYKSRKYNCFVIIDIQVVNGLPFENVYVATGTKTWCETIKTRRLRWFGHVIRLPEETPVKKTLAPKKTTKEQKVGH